MIAGAIANMKSGTRTDLGPIGPRSKSTAEAAAMLNVGVNTVKRAAVSDRLPGWMAADGRLTLFQKGSVMPLRLCPNGCNALESLPL
jgi:hypothetical protein